MTIPRFLHVGDRFSAQLTLLNFTDKALNTEILAHSPDVTILQPAHRAHIPSRDRLIIAPSCSTLFSLHMPQM